MAKFKSSSRLRVFKPAQKKATAPAKPQHYSVERLADDGRGVARDNGKVTFIRGALAGETVEAVVETGKKQFDEARLLKVISPSDQRVEPRCPHVDSCGGCQLQHLNEAGQRSTKVAQIQHDFGELLAGQALGFIDSPHYGYRHRLRLAVKADRNGLVIGHRGRRSHDVVPIEQCPVADQAINRVLPLLKTALSRLQGRSQLVELVLVHGREGVALQCVSKRPVLDKDKQRLAQLNEQAGLCHISVRQQACDEVVLIGGNSLLHYPFSDPALAMQFAPSDFSQVNPYINERMVAQAIEALSLTPNDRVADLFSGVGNFSLLIAKQGCEVVGMEVSRAMVDKAAANAALNQLTAHFEQRDLFVGTNLKLEGFNKVLLDPPRSGAQAVCDWLASADAAQVERIVYVSCNPKTLKRDAQILLNGGYQLETATLLDMFPQTIHAEMMVVLSR